MSLVIPTRDEEETIGECIDRAWKAFDEMGVEGEIIVADSSDDRTPKIAAAHGARVISPDGLGYGNAYLAGFREARGRFIFIMDGDLTYDPSEMKNFVPFLVQGYDLVMGTRLHGRIIDGAMPSLHRYIGNPVLTWILNRLFDAGISDSHCGMRAISRRALDSLHLKTCGMEFASEMIIEAARMGLKIAEVPITYYPRRGRSKLSSFSDGWRHLRFMMLYRPAPFLLGPGFLALLLGAALTAIVAFDGAMRMHSLILGSLLLIIGYQMLLAGIYFGAFGAAYGVHRSGFMKKLVSYHSLEKELMLGMALLALGLALGIRVLLEWTAVGFGSLDATLSAIMALILSLLGIQTIFSGMFISLLLLKDGHREMEG